jgi:hypothetical protein
MKNQSLYLNKLKIMKIFITLLALTAITITNAQWIADTDVNTLVTDSESSDMQSLGTTAGETYVVYWKVVSAPTNYELRLQVLDADGNQTLGNEGILVSDQIPMSTFTVIWKTAVDAEDNLFIGVTGTGGGDPAFAFKLDTSGTSLWGANGVNVGQGNLVTVFPLSTGDAIVAWFSPSGAVMQKYDADGVAVWPSTQEITTGSGFTAPANFFEIAGGNFIAVFHQLLSGINSNLYAQRYNSDGEAQWVNATLLADKTTRFNRSYEGVNIDDSVFMSYSVPTGNRFDAYVQLVNSDGSLPWGINGSDFDTNETNNETEISIALNSLDEIYAVCTYSNPNQSMKGEYIQKFDTTTGARLFTDTAKELYAIGDEIVHVGQLHLYEDTPWFLLKNGLDNGATSTKLEAIYLDENGDFAWTEETRPLATFNANKSRIQYTATVDAQSVAVFIEDKGDGNKIYAQRAFEQILAVNDINTGISFQYNNPVRDILTLESEAEISEIKLYTVTGQLTNTTIENGKDIAVNMSQLASGIYVLQIQTTTGTVASFKVVKQ